MFLSNDELAMFWDLIIVDVLKRAYLSMLFGINPLFNCSFPSQKSSSFLDESLHPHSAHLQISQPRPLQRGMALWYRLLLTEHFCCFSFIFVRHIKKMYWKIWKKELIPTYVILNQHKILHPLMYNICLYSKEFIF